MSRNEIHESPEKTLSKIGCHSASYFVTVSLKYAGTHQKKHSDMTAAKMPDQILRVRLTFLMEILEKNASNASAVAATPKIIKNVDDSTNSIGEIAE